MLRANPRYNQLALVSNGYSRLLVSLLLVGACFFAVSCAVPLGPGYTIEKQEIQVHFVPAPQPHLLVEAQYELRNSGNQPLTELEIRLPGERRFHRTAPQAGWDSAVLALNNSPANARNNLLTFQEPWKISERHTLKLSVEFDPPGEGETKLSFSNDAFFLPAQGWSPDLLPARGVLATGGVPPKKWNLVVRVPQDFLIHASGDDAKKSRSNGEQTIRFTQRPVDKYPFVIAGRYMETRIGSGNEKAYLWTRKPVEEETLRPASDSLVRTLQAYDSVFGRRDKGERPLWIVECPVVTGCFSRPAMAPVSEQISEQPQTSAELISLDSVVVDLTNRSPKLVSAVASSLAASWLGYGQNPGFYEQDPPLSAFPAFAAAVGGEAVDGPESRVRNIRQALSVVPKNNPASALSHVQEDRNIVRAKSILFFYALQDRYGREVFRNALRHMFYARRGGGFDITDLISAFDEESHQQKTAEFVRHWMKRPGVPEEFRAQYESSSAAGTIDSKETMP